MVWRGAFMLVAVVVSGGCLNLNCDPPDPCPGHAVYESDFYVASECACPLRADIASHRLDGTACAQREVACFDSGITCRCAFGPAGAWIWQCDDERDFAVTLPPDLPAVDLGGVADGGGGD